MTHQADGQKQNSNLKIVLDNLWRQKLRHCSWIIWQSSVLISTIAITAEQLNFWQWKINKQVKQDPWEQKVPYLKRVFYNFDSVLITYKESMGSSGGFHMPSAPQFSPGMYSWRIKGLNKTTLITRGVGGAGVDPPSSFNKSTLLDRKDCTNRVSWSKITLTSGGVDGVEVDPPRRKMS